MMSNQLKYILMSMLLLNCSAVGCAEPLNDDEHPALMDVDTEEYAQRVALGSVAAPAPPKQSRMPIPVRQRTPDPPEFESKEDGINERELSEEHIVIHRAVGGDDEIAGPRRRHSMPDLRVLQQVRGDTLLSASAHAGLVVRGHLQTYRAMVDDTDIPNEMMVRFAELTDGDISLLARNIKKEELRRRLAPTVPSQVDVKEGGVASTTIQVVITAYLITALSYAAKMLYDWLFTHTQITSE